MSKKDFLVKYGSTLFLRAAIVGLGLFGLTIWGLLSFGVYTDWGEVFPNIAYMRFPVLLGLLVTITAFITALYQATKLLNYIDKNKAFSAPSVKALHVIKYCGFIFGAVYACGLPIVYQLAQLTDAPGVMVIGLGFTVGPLVIAVFAGVAEKLLQSAIDLKSENDLTV